MKKIRYLIPSMIIIVVLLSIFYINGLYPFGTESIVQVDADYQYIPLFYKIYDILHGNTNMLYDVIGLGNNIYASLITTGSVYSPINLLLYFTPRENINLFFDIIILVKFSLLGLTSYIYIDRTFKVNEFYKILNSVLYAFSAHFLLNYFNIMWLDSIILFPLIMLGLNNLINNNKKYLYIITLSLSLIINYYISYFILLFIVFYSFIYIFLYKDNKEGKNVIFKLGKATLISLLISSFSTVPVIYQVLISSRFGESYIGELMNNSMYKTLYLAFSPFFCILFLLLIGKFFSKNSNKRDIYFYIILFLLFGIGILIEPINLMFHMGSYWDFPYRYGFITTFMLMNGSLYYIENFGNISKHIIDKKTNVVMILNFILLCLIIIYLNNMYYKTIQEELIMLRIEDKYIYFDIVKMSLIIFITYILVLSFSNKKILYLTLSIISIISIYVFTSYTMYYGSGYFLTKNSNEINNNIDLPRNGRYKMDYTTYTPNYKFIYNVETLDNWIHILPDGMVDAYNRLGYLTSGTCIRSNGGTIFTDWLLNFRYVISDSEKNNVMYEYINSYNSYYLYNYKYNLNYGIVYNGNINIEYMYDSFIYQNDIYRNLFNINRDIIEIDNYEYVSDGSNYLEIDYKNDNNGFLYLNSDYNENISYIVVNDNYIYDFKNGIKDLGYIDGNTVIKIFLKNNNYMRISLGFINIDNIIELDSDVSYEDGTYYVYSDNDNNNLFLPINNINGLKVYLNDELVKTDKIFDNFVSLELEKGDNYISYKYEMPYFKLSIILSIIGLILLILYNKITVNIIIINICYYVYVGIVFIFYIFYYFYPLIKLLLM